MDKFMDYFKSFFENSKERITNPFLGTLVFVWIVRNFYLIYAIFNFDDDATLAVKTEYICEHFQSVDIWWDLAIDVLLAFSILLLTYIFKAAAEYIQHFYHDVVLKWIKLTILGQSPFTKEDLKTMLGKLEAANKEIESEQIKNLKSDTTIAELNNSVIELRAKLETSEKQVLEQSDKIIELTRDSEEKMKSHTKEVLDKNKDIKNLNEKAKMLETEIQSYKSILNKNPKFLNIKDNILNSETWYKNYPYSILESNERILRVLAYDNSTLGKLIENYRDSIFKVGLDIEKFSKLVNVFYEPERIELLFNVVNILNGANKLDDSNINEWASGNLLNHNIIESYYTGLGHPKRYKFTNIGKVLYNFFYKISNE